MWRGCAPTNANDIRFLLLEVGLADESHVEVTEGGQGAGTGSGPDPGEVITERDVAGSVDAVVSKVRTWRILSPEDGRYRCPIEKFESTLAAVTGLLFFAKCCNEE